MKIEVNKIVTHIDESGDEIMITVEDGTKYHLYHDQNCCECVKIVDSVNGELHELVGRKILFIEKDNDNDIPEDVDIHPYDSYTWTEISFVTNEKTIISRWIGESNGYYSESVDIEEFVNQEWNRVYGC